MEGFEPPAIWSQNGSFIMNKFSIVDICDFHRVENHPKTKSWYCDQPKIEHINRVQTMTDTSIEKLVSVFGAPDRAHRANFWFFEIDDVGFMIKLDATGMTVSINNLSIDDNKLFSVMDELYSRLK